MKKIMFDDHFGLTQAVLEGRKTMTRRVVGNFAPIVSDVRLNERGCAEARHGDVWFPAGKKKNPKYNVGEIVAVAQRYKDIYHLLPDDLGPLRVSNGYLHESPGATNKMFVLAHVMPHQIRITSVRIERLQDIDDEDCLREGIYKQDPRPGVHALYAFETCTDQYGSTLAKRWYVSPREAFAALIDKVSGKGTWDSNPWVFVYEFELVK